ncbi:CMRF35-like molecule 1 [Carassius gibelio]|uniref:CMRF35-like molecule 1 n=1 Tax=Carassius gibelio TaxID=101364 RepID=UPI0022780924|nr:CMRF35-like molecule 1 [Carassius gibelio]
MKFTFMISAFLLTVSSSVPVDITVRGTEGEQGFLNCPYAEGYENSNKYFYKGPYRERNLLLKSAGGQSSVSEGRFSLLDDHQKRSFTLIIRNLSLTDAGVYTCEAGWGRLYKNIPLKVIRAPQKTRPDQISTSTLHSYTHTSTDKNTEASTISYFSITWSYFRTTELNQQSTSLSITDQLNSSTGSFIIIIIAGGLVLLLICAVLLVVAVWKKHTHGLVSSSAEGVNLTENRRTEKSYKKGNPAVVSNSHTAQSDDGSASNEFHRPANTETVDTDLDYMNVAAAERNAVDPDQIYTELNSSRQSDVYQSLRTDSVQEESIYHSIGH